MSLCKLERESLDELEPLLILRILRANLDNTKQLMRLLQLSKGWTRHISSLYRFYLDLKGIDINDSNWKEQAGLHMPFNSWRGKESLEYFHLEHLKLCGSKEGIKSLKLPHLRSLRLERCTVDSVYITGIQHLELQNANVKELEGNTSCLRSFKVDEASNICKFLLEGKKFKGLRKLELRPGKMEPHQVAQVLDRYASRIVHLALRDCKIEFEMFGKRILSRLQSLHLEPAYHHGFDTEEWNRILSRLPVLRMLKVEGCWLKNTSMDLKWPPSLTQLDLKGVYLPLNYVATIPSGLSCISISDCRGFKVSDVGSLEIAIIQDKDEDLKNALLQAAKNRSLKLLVHNGLTQADMETLRDSLTTTIFTNCLHDALRVQHWADFSLMY